MSVDVFGKCFIIASNERPSGVHPFGYKYGNIVLILPILSTDESYAITTYGFEPDDPRDVLKVALNDTVTLRLSIIEAALQIATTLVIVFSHLSPLILELASTVIWI